MSEKEEASVGEQELIKNGLILARLQTLLQAREKIIMENVLGYSKELTEDAYMVLENAFIDCIKQEAGRLKP